MRGRYRLPQIFEPKGVHEEPQRGHSGVRRGSSAAEEGGGGLQQRGEGGVGGEAFGACRVHGQQPAQVVAGEGTVGGPSRRQLRG